MNRNNLLKLFLAALAAITTVSWFATSPSPTQAPAPPGAPMQVGVPEPLPRLPPATKADRLKPGPHPAGVILGLPVWGERRRVATLTREQLQAYDAPNRDSRQRPEGVLEVLNLQPGAVVADIGAGSGYFSFRFSDEVGPTGKVYATDISINALEYFRDQRLPGRPRSNIYLVLHDETDCLLPDQVADLAFMCDVHFFFYPHALEPSKPLRMIQGFYHSIHRILKPGGRLAIIEKRVGLPDRDQSRGDILDSEIIEQVEPAGFAHEASYSFLDDRYFILFRRVDQ